MTNQQLDALADCYGMLIEWLARKKAAAGASLATEPAAADGTAADGNGDRHLTSAQPRWQTGGAQ